MFLLLGMSLTMHAQVNPTNFEGLSAWWCADSIKQDNNSKVTNWISVYEQNNVVQVVEDWAPTLIKSVPELNNHSVLRFDGNDYLNGGNILNVGDKGQTVFIVCMTKNKDASFYAKSYLGSIKNRNCLIYESKPEFLIQIGNTNYMPTGVAHIGVYDLFSTRIDFSNNVMSLFQSGLYSVLEIPSVSNFSSTFDFLIGGYNNKSGTVPPYEGLYLTGDIAELIFYDHPLSNLERQSVENYLRSKYFPGTEREQFSLGDDVNQPYSLKPVVLSVPDKEYFKKYKWNTGETTKSVTVQSSGMYDVFVTDDWGYEYVDTISISFPELKYIQSQTICDGESLVWDCGLSGDYSYVWSTGETTQAISITKAGKYAVKVTDNEGYSIVSDTVEIFVDDFSTTATLGADTSLCVGNRIGLVSRADDARKYMWSTGESTSMITIKNAGAYSVSVQNENGCVANDDILITIKGDAPIAQFVTKNHCFGDNTELISNSYTTDNTDITRTTWYVEQDTLSGEAQNHIFESVSSQIVTLEVENEAGCVQKYVETITIHPNPIADFSPKIVCQYTAKEILSSSTISSGKIASCSWSGLGKTSEDSSFIFRSDMDGNYPLTLKVVSESGCSDEVTADVGVRPSTKIEFIHDKICVGDTVMVFDVSEYQSYNSMVGGYWDLDGRQNQYTETKKICFIDTLPHLLSLHVMTINGCENIAYDTVKASPVPNPIVQDTVFGCRNANVLLSVQGENLENNSLFVWTVNEKMIEERQPIVDFEKSGIYTYCVEVTSENDCSNNASGKIVIEESPSADFSFYPEYGAAPLDIEFTNLSENATSYEWTMERQNVISDENPHYTFTDEENSYVKLQAFSKHGCADSVTKYIPVQLSNLQLQIVDILATMKNGFIQYDIQILNTGNDQIPEMEISLQSPDFPMLTETWTGVLKANDVLNYTFSVKTAAKNGEIPAFLCASASIASANQNATYYQDEFCKDNSGEFMVYCIAPNPIEKTAQISFNIKQKGTVTIECYDDAGKLRLSQEFSDVSAGFHSVQIDASQLPAGRYTIQIVQGNQKEQMAIMKR